MDREQFRNPGKKFRDAPFWSWNDRLSPEELVRQIASMDEAGWGGFFMHSRVGLLTPYLGEEWMRCIRACVQEAARRGMCAYLYDEDKWPSGFAGGIVPALGPEHRAKALCCKVDNKPTRMAEALARFIGRWEQGKLVGLRRVTTFEGEPDGQAFLTFYPLTAMLGDTWFQGYTYVDLLNPATVRAFLESTYEAYRRVVGDQFGKAVPGIFTDEPCYLFQGLFAGHRWRPQKLVPWTTGLDEYFRRKRGYDLLDVLPSVFFDVGDFRKVRYDFWRTVTERFLEAFSKQMFEWCEQHGLAFTGHFMAEDTLASQIEWIGAAMPHYQYMGYPGIDKLARHIDQVVTCKQVSSAVDQLGKERCLCEAYGCAGQNFSFRGRKWIGDWLYVLGVNLLNPHLSLYSMKGERKRDYPANLFYQQPWWPYNRYPADYFARLSYALTQGKRVVNLLVLHPIGSAWTMYRPDGSQELAEYDAQFQRLARSLLEWHHDYHFGDEMILASHGSVAEGKLRVGEQLYKVVLIPPSVTIASSTAQLLRDFAAAGGAVIAMQPVPTRLDGVPEANPLPASARVVSGDAELRAALDELLEEPVTIVGAPTLWYHYRVDGRQHILFLANTSDEDGVLTTVALHQPGRLESWDLLTGEVTEVPCEASDGDCLFTIELPPAGSALYVLDTAGAPSQRRRAKAQPVATFSASGPYALELLDDNALTLDMVRLRLGNEAERGPMYILDADTAVRDAGFGTSFAITYEFFVGQMPEGEVHLVLEQPEQFRILVNGQELSAKPLGWWKDISFMRFDITAMCTGGRNTITLEGVFQPETELEACYVVGRFGVRAQPTGKRNRLTGQTFASYSRSFSIESLPSEAIGDLTGQGLPFFAGTLALRQKLTLPEPADLAVLELVGLEAIVAEVWLNGQKAGEVFWPPYRVDVTRLVRAGENELELRLVASLRNLLGPHHQRGGDRYWVGPGDFRDKVSWDDDYWLVPFGLDRAVITYYEEVEEG
jgi:hypothetical protein